MVLCFFASTKYMDTTFILQRIIAFQTFSSYFCVSATISSAACALVKTRFGI